MLLLGLLNVITVTSALLVVCIVSLFVSKNDLNLVEQVCDEFRTGEGCRVKISLSSTLTGVLSSVLNAVGALNLLEAMLKPIRRDKGDSKGYNKIVQYIGQKYFL